MKIPLHLSHLRRDRRGLPVPYINRWGPERTDRLTIRHDRLTGCPGVFYNDASERVPDFTAQNFGRQRECMAGGRCQVCARRLRWPDRFVVVAALSTETIDVAGVAHVALSEPWLCNPCATFALAACPALIRRRREENLQLVRLDGPVQLVVSRGWVEGPLEAESKRLQPAMWVKALVPGLVAA